MKTVAVLFGGNSVEHDVSVITGILTSNIIQNYNVVPVYIDENERWFTGEILLDPDNYKKLDYKKLKQVTLINGSNILYEVKRKKLKEICHISSVINCMHGGKGENGDIAGAINICKICYVSPDIMASAISMDKRMTKIVLKGLNVKTLPFVAVEDVEELKGVSEKLSFPLIVKPSKGGSSIGINVANNMEELEKFTLYSKKFGKTVIIEPCLRGFMEINCGAYKDENDNIIVSECERPVGRTEILTFSDKYESGKREFPALISENLSDKIKKITEKVYRELDFKGVVRIDYFIHNNTVYLNEINSIPGSMAYYLFGNEREDFNKMLDSIIKYGEKEFAKNSTITTKFNSGILLCTGAKGAKHL